MRLFVVVYVIVIFGWDITSTAQVPAAPFQAVAPVVIAMPVATPTPVVVVTDPSKTAQVIKAAGDAVDKIPNAFPAIIMTILAFFLELCVRIWPTVKPRSLFMTMAAAFGLIGLGCVKISHLLDQVVQNLKEPSDKA